MTHRTPEADLDDVPGDATRLVRALREAGLTCAVAESLTGGLVLDALVSVPGASAVLRGGLVAYATDVKRDALGVPAELLRRHGAVHPDVATAMARGVRDRLTADVGLATTGVAGPEPQDGEPPGTVHVAVVGPGDAVRLGTLAPGQVPDGRAAVRRAARDAVVALALVALGVRDEGPWRAPDE